MSLPVSNIQRYAIHDGDGIRTSIFFKGCPLACLWCHNPETQSRENAHGVSLSSSELAEKAMRDQVFYGKSGGVTLSGGEPLMQEMSCLLELLKILKTNGINIAIDTCGDVPWENFAAVLPYTDTFLYDIKAASRELHTKYTGAGNERILSNLARLAPLARVWLRVPVIGGVNDGDEMAAMSALAGNLAPGRKVSLLPYHAMGSYKWAKIGKTAELHNFSTPSSEKMKEIADVWEKSGFIVEPQEVL
jgi:pyruvate formate lyase activating enzyme